MSQQYSNPSSQILQRSSASGVSSSRDNGSDNPRSVNSKRSQGDLCDDQVEPPRKLARLEGDLPSKRQESQQPLNSTAKASDPNQELDFVDGPGHIIFIDERGKRCPAICFNKAFLSTITQITALTAEVQEKDGAVQNAERELEDIMSSYQSADLEKAKRVVEEAIKIQEDLEAAIPGLTEARRRCKTLTSDCKWARLMLENSRGVSQFLIEQILDTENLMKKPSSRSQDPVKNKEQHTAEPAPVSENRVDDNQNPDALDRSPAMSTARQQSPIKTEEQITPHQLALRQLRLAAEELNSRRDEFDFIQEGYGPAAAGIVVSDINYDPEQYPDGPPNLTQTEVDLRCFQEKQYATRKVIEAEEAFDRAEQHAETLGLGDILDDQYARFCGEFYNEFAPHTPLSPLLPDNGPRIEAWMVSVPDAVGVGRRWQQQDAEGVEIDDWEAKSVAISDSVSVFARDMYRKKIDKWRELSGRLGEGEAEGTSAGAVRRNPRRRCRGKRPLGENSRTRL